jgi:predicted DCC family thiol-disulfide oxidoreductase YuxK
VTAEVTAETSFLRPDSDAPFDVEVFYDGDCPLCVREIKLLRRLDQHRRIGFVDIASQQFSPGELGVSWQDLMSRIHGRLPDGSLIEGVEVFRRLYSAVGWGRVVSVTRWPLVRQLLDAAYHVFARHRLRLTGRCSAAECSVRRAAGSGGGEHGAA